MAEKHKHPPERLIILDFLRVFAIIAVILIHVTSRTLEQSGFDILRIPLTFYLNTLSRFAVPLFILLSGYALGYRYKNAINVNEFYKKRLYRLALPYLVWSAIYQILIEGKTIFSSDFIVKLINGSAAFHLYFIPAIFLLYLLFPLLIKIKKYVSSGISLVVFTLLEIILLLYDYHLGPLPLSHPVRVALLNMYPFFLGIIAAQRQAELYMFAKKQRYVLISLCVLAAVVSIFESKQLFFANGAIHYVTSQWRVTTFVYMLSGIGVLISFLHNRLEKYRAFITTLSGISFFVYLFHPLAINAFWRIFGSYLFSKTAGHIVENILFDIAGLIFVTVLSFGIGYIAQFIPKSKLLLGTS